MPGSLERPPVVQVSPSPENRASFEPRTRLVQSPYSEFLVWALRNNLLIDRPQLKNITHQELGSVKLIDFSDAGLRAWHRWREVREGRFVGCGLEGYCVDQPSIEMAIEQIGADLNGVLTTYHKYDYSKRRRYMRALTSSEFDLEALLFWNSALGGILAKLRVRVMVTPQLRAFRARTDELVNRLPLPKVMLTDDQVVQEYKILPAEPGKIITPNSQSENSLIAANCGKLCAPETRLLLAKYRP